MSSASIRRLRAEELRQVTMKARVAKWWLSRRPCNCGACQLLAAITSGEGVEIGGNLADALRAQHVPDSTKH